MDVSFHRYHWLICIKQVECPHFQRQNLMMGYLRMTSNYMWLCFTTSAEWVWFAWHCSTMTRSPKPLRATAIKYTDHELHHYIYHPCHAGWHSLSLHCRNQWKIDPHNYTEIILYWQCMYVHCLGLSLTGSQQSMSRYNIARATLMLLLLDQ